MDMNSVLHILSSHNNADQLNLQRYMATYDNETLDHIPLMLLPGDKEYILVYQDESIFHTNEYRQ
jgi:hypothetical protein